LVSVKVKKLGTKLEESLTKTILFAVLVAVQIVVFNDVGIKGHG
jgi:hypothetical protein